MYMYTVVKNDTIMEDLTSQLFIYKNKITAILRKQKQTISSSLGIHKITMSLALVLQIIIMLLIKNVHLIFFIKSF